MSTTSFFIESRIYCTKNQYAGQLTLCGMKVGSIYQLFLGIHCIMKAFEEQSFGANFILQKLTRKEYKTFTIISPLPELRILFKVNPKAGQGWPRLARAAA